MIVPRIDVTARTIRVTMASLTETKKFHTRSIGDRVRFSSAMRVALGYSECILYTKPTACRQTEKKSAPNKRGRGTSPPSFGTRSTAGSLLLVAAVTLRRSLLRRVLCMTVLALCVHGVLHSGRGAHLFGLVAIEAFLLLAGRVLVVALRALSDPVRVRLVVEGDRRLRLLHILDGRFLRSVPRDDHAGRKHRHHDDCHQHREFLHPCSPPSGLWCTA